MYVEVVDLLIPRVQGALHIHVCVGLPAHTKSTTIIMYSCPYTAGPAPGAQGKLLSREIESPAFASHTFEILDSDCFRMPDALVAVYGFASLVYNYNIYYRTILPIRKFG